jgi:hypothetical protein
MTPLFLLTLCRLNAPIALPESQLPQIHPYKFFMSRTRQPDGSSQLLLHVGYFSTREEAEHCLHLLRGSYPEAFVSTPPGMPSATNTEEKPLSDTQVLQILERRDRLRSSNRASDAPGSDISLIKPEDTDTRLALRQAVTQDAPVSFAVQLQWSVQPIDLSAVPSLDIFRAYTLYVAEGRRDRRSWYCLRLGFFKDAISAKQVGHYVRSTFASVAVVPVSEREQEHATRAQLDLSRLAPPLPQNVPTLSPAVVAKPVRAVSTAPKKGESPKRKVETLEQSLAKLAASELFTDEDSLSETGVRHLSFTVKKRSSGR